MAFLATNVVISMARYATIVLHVVQARIQTERLRVNNARQASIQQVEQALVLPVLRESTLLSPGLQVVHHVKQARLQRVEQALAVLVLLVRFQTKKQALVVLVMQDILHHPLAWLSVLHVL